MRRDEWRRAFGGTPEAFETRVQEALNGLREEKKVKKKWSVSISIALAAVLALAGTAFAVANGMGIADFMSRHGKSAAQIDGIVEPAQGGSCSTSRVKYTAQEAVFNGDTLQLTVVCEPLDPEHTLLVGVDELDEDMRTAGGDSVPVPGGDAEADPSWLTVREYAEQNGLEMVRASVSMDVDGCSADYVSRDGRLYYYLRGTFETADRPEPDEDGKYHLPVTVCDSLCAEEPETERGEMEITVEGRAAQDKSVLTFDGPIDMGAYTIDQIEIRVSRQETGLGVRLTAGENLSEEEQAQFDGLLLELMKDGESLERMDGEGGMMGPDSIEAQTDGSGRTFIETMSYDPLEEMPEQFYIRPYNYLTREYGEVIVLSVSDASR